MVLQGLLVYYSVTGGGFDKLGTSLSMEGLGKARLENNCGTDVVLSKTTK